MNKNNVIKILVATHRKYQMPEDEIYLPIQVGKEGKEDLGYYSDNIGDNISHKNDKFCELTGLYWAWKNLDADYIGLCHYRRYFTCETRMFKKQNQKFNMILNRKELEVLLEKTDVILPKKRNYYIQNLYDHYKSTMYIEPLDETRKIIEEQCPDYLKEFDRLYKRKSAHMFNMFIMKKEYFEDYCEWLFKILFELEERTKDIKYDKFHNRYIGRISELLLDIWINKNQIKYKEIKVLNMQKNRWFKKITSFLSAKYFGKKYTTSF